MAGWPTLGPCNGASEVAPDVRMAGEPPSPAAELLDDECTALPWTGRVRARDVDLPPIPWTSRPAGAGPGTNSMWARSTGLAAVTRLVSSSCTAICSLGWWVTPRSSSVVTMPTTSPRY
jgi:hypothetical protein